MIGFLRKKMPPEHRHGRFESADFNRLSEGLVKKVGRMEAEKIRSAQINKKLQKEIDKRNEKILEMSKEKIMYSPFIKRNSLSVYDLIYFSRKKKPIKVLFKDHKYAGKLMDVRISVLGETYVFDIITEIKTKDKKKHNKVIMRHTELGQMFHNPIGFVDALRNGVLILNKLSTGAYVPDIFTEDGRGVDQAFGDMLEREEVLEEIASKNKTRADDERYRRQIEGLGQESEIRQADIATAALVRVSNRNAELQKQIGEDIIDKNIQTTKLNIYKNHVNIVNANMEKILDRLKKQIKFTDYEKIKDEFKDFMDMYTKQFKSISELAVPKNVTLLQEKKNDKPKPEVGGKTLHPLKKLGAKK